MTPLQLLTVPATHIDFAWRDGAAALAESCAVSGGEITGDQLKLILARGERQLLQMHDGERAAGWVVVTVEQAPNLRMLFVTDLYAPHVGVARIADALKRMAASLGCSRLRCAARPAQARLYRMQARFKPVCQILEIEI